MDSDTCRHYIQEHLPVDVFRATEKNGTLVGFKRVLNKCPTNFTSAPLFGEGIITETIQDRDFGYQFTLEGGPEDGSGPFRWTIKGKSGPIQCQKDSIALFRGENQVCVSIRLFSTSQSQARNESVALCTTDGGMGLTGPYSKIEMNAIAAYYQSEFKDMLSSGDFSTYGFWMDGTRENIGEIFKLTDDTLNAETFSATLRDTKPIYYQAGNANCTLLHLRSKTVQITAYGCSSDLEHISGCARGALCRTEPMDYV